MLLLPLLILLQAPTERAVLETEHARSADVSTLVAAIKSQDPRLQRLGARAVGRIERPGLAELVVPLIGSGNAEVRREAIGALAQMGGAFNFVALLPGETSGVVRSVIYEAIGRARPPAPESEAALIAGLEDKDAQARTGAARGLETLVRLNLKTTRPSPATILALRAAVKGNAVSDLRQFALLALNAAGDQDGPTLDVALQDADPQVRRLAVIGGKRWVDDPSPMVRLEAIRVAGTCEKALGAVEDQSGHVVLAAVDFLGSRKCDASRIEELVERGKTWRVRSHALVALAKVAPEAARAHLEAFAADPAFQVRTYAATAAILANDAPILARLARDVDPNVALAALTTLDDAVWALSSDHLGLLLAAAEKLLSAPEARDVTPPVLATIQRLNRTGHATVRDARVRLIEVLGKRGDLPALQGLRPLLADRDPAVASAVAKILSERTGKTVVAETKSYRPEPFPSEAALRSVAGARAVVTMRDLGVFTLELLPDEAPATTATFADLVRRGAYDGLTFHRVVPNFVLQGGSPGADEYDALTPQFMRDELGFTSNRRGTVGISTRGHDTGDGQIYINLVDNWRLDHTYTVFAQVVEGLEVVDRILEGDVIKSIRMERGRQPVSLVGGTTDVEYQDPLVRCGRGDDDLCGGLDLFRAFRRAQAPGPASR